MEPEEKTGFRCPDCGLSTEHHKGCSVGIRILATHRIQTSDRDPAEESDAYALAFSLAWSDNWCEAAIISRRIAAEIRYQQGLESGDGDSGLVQADDGSFFEGIEG